MSIVDLIFDDEIWFVWPDITFMDNFILKDNDEYRIKPNMTYHVVGLSWYCNGTVVQIHTTVHTFVYYWILSVFVSVEGLILDIQYNTKVIVLVNLRYTVRTYTYIHTHHEHTHT